jgi:hypothetical protein
MWLRLRGLRRLLRWLVAACCGCLLSSCGRQWLPAWSVMCCWLLRLLWAPELRVQGPAPFQSVVSVALQFIELVGLSCRVTAVPCDR